MVLESLINSSSNASNRQDEANDGYHPSEGGDKLTPQQRWPIAKEGFPFLFPSALATVLFAAMGWMMLTFLGFLLTLIVAFFFRNLKREVPDLENVVLSPVDGTIIDVKESWEDRFLKETALKVRISTSLLDAHLLWTPVSSKLLAVSYQPSPFRMGSRDKSSHEGERNVVMLETADRFKIVLVQIAGLVPKQMVCYPHRGARLEKGQIFGVIFGSRFDLYLPTTVKPTISIGQHVKGGESVIGFRG
jgi:phosphatidylserine decarboxylase